MKLCMLLISMLLADVSFAEEVNQNLDQKLKAIYEHEWYHGTKDCKNNTAPAIEVYQFSENTYVLRQNKCLHYEAPFIYVLFGEHTVFIQDTGATADANLFPLFETIKKIVQNRATKLNKRYRDYKWLVTHSHGHSDHIAGDKQFENKAFVMLVKPNKSAVQAAFNIGKDKWPSQNGELDLGGRTLTIIPLPGHKSDAIAVYDSETKWLLTGDSVYPGRLYVKNWSNFRKSIKRLTSFANANPITAVMGTHIEMSKQPGRDFKMGSTYQPNEASLPMSVEQLYLLNNILQKTPEPIKVINDKFIVYPLD